MSADCDTHAASLQAGKIDAKYAKQKRRRTRSWHHGERQPQIALLHITQPLLAANIPSHNGITESVGPKRLIATNNAISSSNNNNNLTMNDGLMDSATIDKENEFLTRILSGQLMYPSQTMPRSAHAQTDDDDHHHDGDTLIRREMDAVFALQLLHDQPSH